MSDMKILVVDIETCPNLVWTWSLYPKYIHIDNIVEPTQMISWAAKWVGKSTIYYKNRNAEDFLTRIYDLIEEADAVVTYNGKSFDMRHLNREFAEAGMSPPHMPVDIDLLKTIRQRFNFPSNKLEYVAQRLLGEGKIKTDFDLWLRVLNNERAAWSEMRQYNRADVALTERLYLHIRGWIKGHPNHGLYVADQDNPICRNCGSDHVVAKGWQPTSTRGYHRYKCMDCGANLRGRNMIKGGKLSPQVVT